jgi:hypothetical protein
MTKQSDYTWFSRLAPYAWIGAILFFLATEAIVLAAEMRGLSGFSLARRMSLPAALIGPLAVGAGLARLIQKKSEQSDQGEIGDLSMACIALLTLMTYAILTGTVSTSL